MTIGSVNRAALSFGYLFSSIATDAYAILGDPPPTPDIVSVIGIPSSVQVGEPFTVTITAENESRVGGVGGPDSAINVSVLYSDGSDDLSISGPDGVGDWAEGDPVNFEPGEGPLYDNNCQQIPGGAIDHVVEASESHWVAGEQHSMSVIVTPHQVGTLWFRVRTTMSFAQYRCVFENDHTVEGGTDATDQQGWGVAQFSIAVLPSGPDLVASDVAGPDGPLSPGQEATISFTVTNQGDSATGICPFTGTSDSGIMWSTDDVITTDDMMLETEFLGCLPAGESSLEAHVVAIPPGAIPGRTYWVGICVDWNSDVREIIEDNNCNAFPAPVTVPRQIDFSKQWWDVFSGHGGPGPNEWSSSEENVWKDEQDRLHLAITQREPGGGWHCAAVSSTAFSGYGTYVFWLDSRVDTLDRNVVAGLFVYSDNYENDGDEIDIEFSRWGQRSEPNAQFVVQPADSESTLHRFEMLLNGNFSTHKFTWRPDLVLFDSYQGHGFNNPIESWDCIDPESIPVPDVERVHLNLWLKDGEPPTDGKGAEIVISAVDFIPLCSSDVDTDGEIDIADLLVMLSSWGCVGSCAADIDEDGTVNRVDLELLLAAWAWGGCPKGAWQFNTANKHWYRLTAPGTWEQAEAEAVGESGHLVTINDGAEQEWLNSTFPRSTPSDPPLWIGLRQVPGSVEPGGGWEWISGEPLAFANWHPDEPNDGTPMQNENRAEMHHFAPQQGQGLWNDSLQSAVRPGVIEVETRPRSRP